MDSMNNDIGKIQEEFYTASRRNIFLKNAQKTECAHMVSSKIPLDELVRNTVYAVEGGIYVDYPMFKMFATPLNYDTIVAYLLTQINEVIRKHDTFTIHINLQSFSMSAVERYNTAIQLFCNECCKNDTQYIRAMKNMYIYHTPTMMRSISSMLVKFTNESIKEKIVFYSKDESSRLLIDLLLLP